MGTSSKNMRVACVRSLWGLRPPTVRMWGQMSCFAECRQTFLIEIVAFTKDPRFSEGVMIVV